MRKKKLAVTLVLSGLLLCLIPIIIAIGFNAFEDYRLNQARRGLELIEAGLPLPTDFRLIKTVPYDNSISAYGETCYYATDHLIMGASLPEMQALDTYESSLRSDGWLAGEIQYPRSRAFYLGENAVAVITTIGPGDDTRDAVDYERLREQFESVVFVRLEFQLPSTSEC